MITALLHAEDVSVAPGDHTSVPLDLVNSGTNPVIPRIVIRGAPSGLVSAPQLTQPIQPGATVRVEVGFAVPRTFSSGQHQLSLEITGAEGHTSHHRFTLSVLPLDNVALSVNPSSPRGRFRGRFRVVLQNRSSSTKILDLTSDSDDVHIRFKPAQVRVRPGERTTTKATVRSRPVLFNQNARKPFTVLAKANSRPLRTGGVFTQRPLIGAMPRRGALIAAMVGAAVLAVIFTIDTLRDARNDEVAQDTASETSGSGGDDADGSASGSGADGSDGAGEDTVAALAHGEVALSDELAPEGVEISLRAISLDDPRDPNTKILNEQGDRASSKNFALVMTRVRAQQASNSPFSVITGDDGIWALDGMIPGGHYELKFSKTGYTSQAFVVSPTEFGEQIELEVTLSPGDGSIGGVVTDGTNRLGGATVTVTDGDLVYQATTSTKPGEIGEWLIEGIGTPAHYVVTIEMPGFATEVRSVDLGPGESDRGVTSSLTDGAGSIQGRIANEGGLGGVSVTVTSDDLSLSTHTLSTGDPGSFHFPDLPLDIDYTVVIEGSGYLTQTRNITLNSNVDLGAITLTRSTAEITDKVVVINTDPDVGINGVSIVLTAQGGDLQLKTTSATDGSFLFPSVPPGDYRVVFEHFGHQSLDRSITLEAGQSVAIDPAPEMVPVDVEHVPLPNIRVTGQVSDSVTSAPLVGVSVVITGTDRDNTPFSTTAVSDGTGTYTYEGLDYGVYLVRVEPTSEYQSFDGSFESNEPDETFPIALDPLGSFDGRVVANASGDGINGASVSIFTPTGPLPLETVATSTDGGITGSWAFIDRLFPGSYRVRASATGYLEVWQSPVVVPLTGGNTTLPDFQLVPRPALDVQVRAPIVAGCGSEPCFADVVDATVEIISAPIGYQGDSNLTSATATVTFEEPITGTLPETHKLVAGSYWLQVSAAGFDTTGLFEVVVAGTDPSDATAARTVVTVALTQSIAFDGDEIGGRILGPTNGSNVVVTTATSVVATTGVVSGFTPATGGGDAVEIVVPYSQISLGTWTSPFHRYGTAEYTFTNIDFDVRTLDITSAADDATDHTNDIDVVLVPKPSSINGTLSVTSAAPVDYTDFRATAAAVGGFVADESDVLDAGGFFDITGLAPGAWQVTIAEIAPSGDYILPTNLAAAVGPNDAYALGIISGTENADLLLDVAAATPASAHLEYPAGTPVTGTVMANGANEISFGDLDPTLTYTAVISAAEHDTKTVLLAAIGAGQNANIPVDLEQWGLVSGTVRGVIGINNPGATALENASVELTNTGTTTAYGPVSTNALGYYELRVPAGSYTATFSATNYSSIPNPDPGTFAVANDLPSALGTIDLQVTPVNLEFEIQSLVDGGANTVLAGAIISLDSMGAETDPANGTTAATGRATFTNLQPIIYEVTISATDHLTQVVSVTVQPGGIGLQTIVLSQTTGSVSGKVTAEIDLGGAGKFTIGPVAGVEVGLVSGDGPATTDAAGDYTINNLANRTYPNVPFDAQPGVTNTLYDLPTHSIQIQIPPGAVAQNATLTPTNGTITATVSLPRDNPAMIITSLEAKLVLVTVADNTETVYRTTPVPANGIISWTAVPPSKPHNLATPLYFWRVKVDKAAAAPADPVIQASISANIDLIPAGSAAPAVPVLSVPAAPAAPTVTGALGGFSASWAAVPTENDGGSTITHYTVAWDPAGPATGSSADTADGSTISLAVGSLTPGTEYAVTVVAVNAVGNSIASSATNVTVPTVPDAPTAFLIAPGASPGGVSASWTASVANGFPVLEYQVEHKPTSGTWADDGTTVANATSPTAVASLTVGTSYDFRVRARNAAGWGAYATSSFIALGTPEAPTTLVVIPDDTELRVSWMAHATTGGGPIVDYTVTLTGGAAPIVQSVGSAATNILVPSLVNGTEYTITVTASNDGFTSDPSASTTGTPNLQTPSVPTAFSTSRIRKTSFEFEWSRPADDGGDGTETLTYEYELTEVGQAADAWVDLGDQASDNDHPEGPFKFRVNGLTAATDYTIVVRAKNSAAEGTSTAALAVTTDDP